MFSPKVGGFTNSEAKNPLVRGSLVSGPFVLDCKGFQSVQLMEGDQCGFPPKKRDK